MRILGIDPGSRFIGFALLDVAEQKHKLTLVKTGVIRISEDIPFLLRPGKIFQEIQKILLETMPEEVALESLVAVKGTTSILKLSQARGAILAAVNIHLQKMPFEYSPNLVKSVAAGHGHAQKDEVQKGLLFLLGKHEFETHDASDALAVALCHSFHRDLGERKGQVVPLPMKAPIKKRARQNMEGAVQHVLNRLKKSEK